MNKHWLICAWWLPAFAVAQAQMPTEFPANANEPTADALRALLSGKVFAVQPFSGPGWRIQLDGGGYAFLDVSNGRSDKGRWRVEGDKLCVDWKVIPSACNTVRLQGDTVYLKRVNGEVVKMDAR